MALRITLLTAALILLNPLALRGAERVRITKTNLGHYLFMGGAYRIACELNHKKLGSLNTRKLRAGAFFTKVKVRKVISQGRRQIHEFEKQLKDESSTVGKTRLLRRRNRVASQLDQLKVFQAQCAAGSGSSSSSSSSAPVTRTIVPGEGFLGETPQPPAVGGGRASDAKAIARWDVVPYQTFSGSFNVGVVAFHINGIERVEFSAKGGAWVAAREMEFNPDTRVREYFGTLRANDFAQDELVEVRAVAYPAAGVPRVLDSLFLYANPQGSTPGVIYASTDGSNDNAGTRESPLGPSLDKSLDSVPDGGMVVLLTAGIYYLSGESSHRSRRTVSHYVTIRAEDGLAPKDVRIRSSGGAMISRLTKTHWLGVGFDLNTGQYIPEPGGLDWFDHCYWTFNGWQNTDFMVPVAHWSGQLAPNTLYITDTYAYDGVYGTVGDFVRNCTNEKISGAPFLAPALLINSSVSNFNSDWIQELPSPPANPYHRDIWHAWWGPKNTIAYGVTATDRVDATVIRLEGADPLLAEDNAFVDWNIVNLPHANGVNSNWGRPYVAIGTRLNNLLVHNFYAPNNRWSFNDNNPLIASNFYIRNSGFHWATFDSLILHPEGNPPGLTILNQGNYKASVQDWAPTNLAAVAENDGIKLSWTAGPGETSATRNDSFNVRRSQDGGESWQQIAGPLFRTTLGCTDLSVEAGSAYRYVIESINNAQGAREYTNVVQVTAQ